jgi:hypothetical protein
LSVIRDIYNLHLPRASHCSCGKAYPCPTSRTLDDSRFRRRLDRGGDRERSG